MRFRIVGQIAGTEIIAVGSGIREIARLRKFYGQGRWRKMKGQAWIVLADGATCEAEVTGMKPPESERKNSRSSVFWSDLMSRGKLGEPQFAVCIDNRDYPASLELRKIYRVTPDPTAARHGQIRIVDESGEDYLYPQVCFLPIKLPQAAEQAILKAS